MAARDLQQIVPVPLVEDPGLHVQRLGRDPQRLGELLQDVGARLAQPALDLAQIRVGHPGGVGELPQRELARCAAARAGTRRRLPTFREAMSSTMPVVANYCKRLACKCVGRAA